MSGIHRILAGSAVSALLLLPGVGTPGGAIGVPHTRVELQFVDGCSGAGTIVIDNATTVARVERIDVAWSPSMPVRAGSLLLDDSAPPNVQLFLDDGTLVYAATGAPGVQGFEVLATLDCSTIPYSVVAGLPNTAMPSGREFPPPVALALLVIAALITSWRLVGHGDQRHDHVSP